MSISFGRLCPGEDQPHGEACDLLDFIALADDEKHCCLKHHPDAVRRAPAIAEAV
ncbi:hypothetical protein SAMN05216251_12817 [Actinacidiphila alni]|uniref:Uncharacterized protein n=1 Tax=Actinacidiphila alni TaxID=380248 RepID=A0A1I2LBS5_9ACTN|nr:hypothetical protein [Actinacidiphila alni]SFF76842.1 hypothetical protein SAMN05216251_12817 [Actinacidiphila alni]